MHAHDVGRREAGITQRTGPPVADGAQVRAAPADQVRRLREQVGAGGLAVRAREACDAQLCRRPVVEAVGEFAGEAAQARNRDHDDVRRHGGRLEPGARLPEHRNGATADRVGCVRKAVLGAALAGEECSPRRDVPAVERQAGQLDIAQRQREPVEQRGQRHAVLAHARVVDHGAHALVLATGHHGSCACTSVVAGMRCRSSGGTASSRSAPDITAENTGAATSPP